jgi:signal transduction histidine kinase
MRLRLHHRIVILFALIAIVATSFTAYVALTMTARAMQTRVESQIRNAATLIGQSDVALNPTMLQSVKAIAGADVVTFTDRGDVLASTLSPGDSASVVTAVRERLAQSGAPAGPEPVIARIDCRDQPCDVAYRSMASRAAAIVAVVTTRTEILGATRTVTRAIVIAAFLSLLGMIALSQVVARRITGPIDALVRFTGGVGAGDLPGRAPAGEDEIGGLGRAFNDMLDRVNRSQAALVRSEKLALAGLFAARVAHDIRNPLSAMKIQAQLLRARLGAGSDRQTVAMLDAIHRDILQVETVVRDLLDLARPGELKREPVRLTDVVDDALDHVGPHLTYRKIQIYKQMHSPLPPIPLDATRFKQALLNIIDNAADAMPTGGTLTVSAQMLSESSEVRLDVSDTGTGIDPALLPNVFDPFVSSKRDGMGLGLVNAKAVVEGHGGRIEIAPMPPAGTRVSMWLPVNGATRG